MKREIIDDLKIQLIRSNLAMTGDLNLVDIGTVMGCLACLGGFFLYVKNLVTKDEMEKYVSKELDSKFNLINTQMNEIKESIFDLKSFIQNNTKTVWTGKE